VSGFSAQLPAPQDPPPAVPAPPQGWYPAVAVVVIDPAHGGADSGARGTAGIVEKDVTLYYALMLRDLLQRQGLRVVLTRYGGENPSFDERAGVANSYRSTLYLSMHVASTGPPETVRCYYDALPATGVGAPAIASWDRAQEGYLDASQRLASLIQAQAKQAFPNSPAEPAAIPVRPLRNVAAPAVAVEISSVSVRDRAQLDRMAVPLAGAVARAVLAFRGESR